jgi:RNA polymerase sigma-70 factor (ECF subfamily)
VPPEKPITVPPEKPNAVPPEKPNAVPPEKPITVPPEKPITVPPENQLPLHDPERLGALFARLEPRLRAVALRITRQPEAARDAVQDAFEKALRHGHRFEGQSRVSTWLHRIVANEALMWLRSQRRRSEVQTNLELDVLELQPAPGPSPAQRASSRERAARLEHGLSELSAEDRDVVLQCAVAGESYADYGARRGLHPGAVKSRAFRARRRLEAYVEAEAGAEAR